MSGDEDEKKRVFLSSHSSLFGRTFVKRFTAADSEWAGSHELLPVRQVWSQRRRVGPHTHV